MVVYQYEVRVKLRTLNKRFLRGNLLKKEERCFCPFPLPRFHIALSMSPPSLVALSFSMRKMNISSIGQLVAL